MLISIHLTLANHYLVRDSLLGEKTINIVFSSGYSGLRYPNTISLVSFYQGRGPVVHNLIRYYNKVESSNLIYSRQLADGTMLNAINATHPQLNFGKYINCLRRELVL